MASTQHDVLVEELTPGGRRPTPDVKPSPEGLVAARAAMEEFALPIDAGVASEAASLGGVPGIWFRPDGTEDIDAAIIYFHGGGFMFGSPSNTGHVTARLAKAAGIPAFSVDYRLSWQAPFPAPVEDALAVYRALLDTGLEPECIALAGDSAGGGLAISTLVAARDAGLALPSCAYTTSAFTDCTVSGESVTGIDDPIVSGDGLLMLADAYLDGADPTDPLASPLFADLHGLPPLLLHVGGREALLDDTIRVADRARAAGVEVTVEVIDGAIHIWQYFGPDLPETVASDADAGRFLTAHTRLIPRPGG